MHTKQKQKVIKLSCTQSYALQKYNYGIQGLQERLELKVSESPNSSEGFAMQFPRVACPDTSCLDLWQAHHAMHTPYITTIGVAIIII